MLRAFARELRAVTTAGSCVNDGVNRIDCETSGFADAERRRSIEMGGQFEPPFRVCQIPPHAVPMYMMLGFTAIAVT
jgi:hypothetical protein